MPTSIAIRIAPAAADEDRVVHRVSPDGADLVIVADGAGGISGGREAASFVTTTPFAAPDDVAGCVDVLSRLDRELAAQSRGGETTAVLVVVRGHHVFGGSVGDSGVWAIAQEASFDLTSRQHRKPLLGSGYAVVVGWGPHFFNDRLLVATDGLLKYVAPARLKGLALMGDLEGAADALVAAARLPSGGLQDDVGLALLAPRR